MANQGSFFPDSDYKPDKTLRNLPNPLAYEVRKIQMAIRAIDKELYKNPSKINIPAYLDLLKAHTEKLAMLKKTDYFNRKGVDNDEEAMAEEVSLSEDTAGACEEVSPGVDSRISAHDTFAA